MTPRDKAMPLLLELHDPAARRTRTALLEQGLRALLTVLDADAAALLVSEGKRGERLILHAGSEAPATMPVPAEGSEVQRLLGSNSQPLLLDLSNETSIAGVDGCPGIDSGPVLFAAIRRRDATPGYAAVYRRRGRARFNVAEVQLMVLLAAWIGTALEAKRLQSGAQRLVVTDDLTGVYNYGFLKQALRRELRRASRFGHELSIVLLEIDRLAEFTGEHGALRGSLLQKELATVLGSRLRAFDVPGRHRKHGFLVILPQTGHDGALEVAERLRTAIEEYAFSGTAPGRVTVSVGMSTFPRDAGTIRDLHSAAEQALRRARSEGANRVAAPRKAA